MKGKQPRPAEVVVFSSLNVAEVHLVRDLLAREGIPARLRNHLLAPLAGEVPMNEVRAEVRVDAEHAAAAEAIVAEARHPRGVDRPCPACGEENPPGFEICWNCGADVPPAHLRLVSSRPS